MDFKIKSASASQTVTQPRAASRTARKATGDDNIKSALAAGRSQTGQRRESAEMLARTEARNHGASLSQSSVEGLARTAANALGAIETLRNDQLKLASEAAGLPAGERLSELNSQFTAIQEPISQIASEATYNGASALKAGGVYSPAGENGPVVGLADFSSIAADTGASLSTPEEAEAAVSAITSSVAQASQARSSAASAASAAVQPAVKPVRLEHKIPETAGGYEKMTEEEADDRARQVSRKIADTLSMAEGNERIQAIKKLIDTSIPEKTDHSRLKELLK